MLHNVIERTVPGSCLPEECAEPYSLAYVAILRVDA